MSKIVDYYFSPVSPWAYLGHERFLAIAARAGASVRPRPVDYGRIFPVSGGLPLKQRPAQRQAYRMMELKRWRDFLGLPLILEPKFFPVNADPACLMLTAALGRGVEPTLQLAGAMMRAVWAEERNLADPDTLLALADACGLDGPALAQAARSEATAAAYAKHTDEAIERKVFGAPTYVLDGELFWGQDRLDFLERALGGVTR